MKRTNSQRQAAYRERHLRTGACRLDTVIGLDARQAFERLARSFALSKRETIEQLVTLAESSLLLELPEDQRKRYFLGQLNFDLNTLRLGGVSYGST